MSEYGVVLSGRLGSIESEEATLITASSEEEARMKAKQRSEFTNVQVEEIKLLE